VRMSNQEFEAEVRRRAAQYQQQERSRRRHIFRTVGTIAACFVLAVGIGVYAFPHKNYDNATMNEAANGKKNADAAPAAAESVQKNDATYSIQTGVVTVPQSPKRDEAAEAPSSQLNIKAGNSLNEIKQYDAEEQAADNPSTADISMTLQNPVIQQGTNKLDLMITNNTAQTFTVSSIQFLLTREYENGKAVGYTRDASKSLNETRAGIAAGSTVPFTFELDVFTEELTAGNYTLRLFDSEVQFTIQ